MEVSHAVFKERKHTLYEDRTEKIPHSLFSLTPKEWIAYNSFKVTHGSLEGKVRGMHPLDRRKAEGEAQEMFGDLVAPYFQSCGLKAVYCDLLYGSERNVIVDTPNYSLFKDGKLLI